MPTKILLIEPDTLSQKKIADYLSQPQYIISYVVNCEEASHQIKSSLFDLFIISENVPGFFDFIANYKEHYINAETPIIILGDKNIIDPATDKKLLSDDYINYKDLNANILTKSINFLTKICKLKLAIEVEQTTLSNTLINLYENRLDHLENDISNALIKSGKSDILNYKEEIISSLASLIYHDPITKLPNKRSLEKAFLRLNDAAERYNRQSAFLLLEITYPNKNDLDPQMKNQLLKKCAAKIVDRIRSSDFIASIGNFSFALILNTIRNEIDAGLAAERLCEVFNSKMIIEKKSFKLSLRIGIVLLPTASNSIEELIFDASSALNNAKSDAKTRHGYFNYYGN